MKKTEVLFPLNFDSCLTKQTTFPPKWIKVEERTNPHYGSRNLNHIHARALE